MCVLVGCADPSLLDDPPPGLRDLAVGEGIVLDTGQSFESDPDSAHDSDSASTPTDSDHDSTVDSAVDSARDSTAESGIDIDTSVQDSGLDTGQSPADTALDTASDSAGPMDSALPSDSGEFADTGVSLPDSGPNADTGGAIAADTAPPRDTGWVSGPPADTADSSVLPVDTAPTDTADPDTDSASDSAADPGKDTSTSAIVDTSTDTAVTADTAADTGSVVSAAPVHFLVLGDQGTGDAGQYAVSAAMADVCATEGCDFAILVGDNIYPNGPASTTDSQWTDKFEDPYAAFGFQFIAVLGNHDYGSGFDVTRAQAEVDYSAVSTKWYMPDFYFTHETGDVTFYGLDTQAILESSAAPQELWLPMQRAASSTTWNLAVGHHPYLSNGPHGNAGEYEGISGEGVEFEDFFDTYICDQYDVYFCGHDHSLQWMESPCTDTQLIVSGGGSHPSGVFGTDPYYFEDATAGFMWVEIDGSTLTGVFYDDSGTELYRRSVTK